MRQHATRGGPLTILQIGDSRLRLQLELETPTPAGSSDPDCKRNWMNWMIGDSERDIIAASRAGIQNTVLVRSGHKVDEENSQAKYFLNSIKEVKDLIKI